MKMIAFVFALALAACGGDDAPATPDAANLPACTGALYDPCTDNSQCMSGNCRMFNDLGIRLCTQDCATTACPDQNGSTVSCSMGNNRVCRPTMANACTR